MNEFRNEIGRLIAALHQLPDHLMTPPMQTLLYNLIRAADEYDASAKRHRKVEE